MKLLHEIVAESEIEGTGCLISTLKVLVHYLKKLPVRLVCLLRGHHMIGQFCQHGSRLYREDKCDRCGIGHVVDLGEPSSGRE